MMQRTQQPGFVVLLGVVVVGVVCLAISTSLMLTGTDSQRAALVVQQSAQARQLAHACAEEGLQQLQTSTTYTGTAGLTMGAGTCTYTVANPGGSARTVTAVGAVGDSVRNVQVSATIGSTISITTWQDTP